MTEHIDKDGIVYYILPHKKTISKHRYLYEQYHNEPTLKNEIIIFLDGNRRNFSIDNLYKLTRGELVTLNRWFGISSDPEETLLHIQIVKIKQKRVQLARKAGLTDSRGNIIEDVAESKRKYIENHPERIEKDRARAREWQRKARADPVKYKEMLRKQKESRAKARTSLHP